MGAATTGGRNIWFSPTQKPLTPAHEFGHIFGLRHPSPADLPLSRSIMSGNPGRSVQYEDIRTLIDTYQD